jgi:hypothetical protein
MLLQYLVSSLSVSSYSVHRLKALNRCTECIEVRGDFVEK